MWNFTDKRPDDLTFSWTWNELWWTRDVRRTTRPLGEHDDYSCATIWQWEEAGI